MQISIEYLLHRGLNIHKFSKTSVKYKQLGKVSVKNIISFWVTLNKWYISHYKNSVKYLSKVKRVKTVLNISFLCKNFQIYLAIEQYNCLKYKTYAKYISFLAKVDSQICYKCQHISILVVF